VATKADSAGNYSAEVSDDMRASSRPVGVTAVSHRDYRYGSLAFVNRVQGAVVGAPTRPQLLKGRIQWLAEPVWIAGDRAG
jgi:hypothetical protein